MFKEAESLLLDLRDAVTTSGESEYSANVKIFHVWVSLARVFHLQARWGEALSHWLCALTASEGAGLGGGLNAGIVRYSIAHVLLMMGSNLESKKMVELARANIASEPRVFWIPCFNSQWHEFIVRKMNAEFGFEI